MTATAPARSTPSAVPTRFRENEARGRRIGRVLRRFGHVDGPVDEILMARMARGLTERDETAAALADAIRMRAGDPHRVTHAQLRAALAGAHIPADAPPALRDFLATVTAPPTWVDWDLVERGARVLVGFGRNAADVLLQLSLLGGYRFGGPPDLLVRTGGLTGRHTLRRLAETQHWAAALHSADALRPGGEGWRLTLHVRVMHALVNATHEPTWDVARWGLPINQADQAGTLGLFDGTLLLGCRALGVPVPAADARALMHLWRYVGWLMGVHEDFLTDDERERHRINYHILLAAPDVTPAGADLARAAVAAQRARRYPASPGALEPLHGRVEQERLLSMLSVFLGRDGMADLGLGWRPPWAYGYRVLSNGVRYRVLDRLPAGGARRLARGRRERARVLASYFRDDPADVAALDS